ncbi:caspase family protein [Chloroflexota bacterium]
MKRVILSSVAAFLAVLLMLSSVAYAAGSPDESQPVNFETGNTLGIKGKPDKPPGKPPKGDSSGAATGIVADPVEGEKYAIIIGISDYPGDGTVLDDPQGMDLFYCDDDARTMKDTLDPVDVGAEDYYSYGFAEENIILLLDSDATRDSILDAIDAVGAVVDDDDGDDEVVFFFSGHGTIQSIGGPKGEKSKAGNNVGIISWDDDAEDVAVVWDYELQGAFSGDETDRIVYIFDCCNSGGMTELGERENSIVCMSTTESGVSYEYGQDYIDADYPSIPGLPPVELPGQLIEGQGLFTYFFVVLGMQYLQADQTDTDGVVTIEEAFDFARSNLDSISRSSKGQLRQKPTIVDNFEDDLLL